MRPTSAKAGRTHVDAASSMMPPSRTGLRCCMRVSDEERREAVDFLRSGKCLYFAGAPENGARLQPVHEGGHDAFRPLRCTLRFGQLRDRCMAEIGRPNRPPDLHDLSSTSRTVHPGKRMVDGYFHCSDCGWDGQIWSISASGTCWRMSRPLPEVRGDNRALCVR